MTISRHLKTFLNQNDANYDVVSHPYTERTLDTAHSACIPTRAMAKAVVLKDAHGPVMAVMPANNRLMLRQLNLCMNRHLKLVHENTLNELFPDCQPGAIPAMGQAWGIPTAFDDTLDGATDIYFEAGNHRELVHMHRDQFLQLIGNQVQESISCSPEDRDLFKRG